MKDAMLHARVALGLVVQYARQMENRGGSAEKGHPKTDALWTKQRLPRLATSALNSAAAIPPGRTHRVDCQVTDLCLATSSSEKRGALK